MCLLVALYLKRFKSLSIIISLIFLLLTTNTFAEERIVSLSPNIAEILFKIGVGDYIVGVTKECDYPESAKKIRKVGSYYHINIEEIVILNPTVVFGMKDGYSLNIKKRLDDLNIENYFFESHSYSDVIDIIKYLSKRYNLDCSNLIDKINVLFSEKTICDKSALFLVNLDPLIAAGKNSFIDDILRCGGFNNYIQGNLTYPKVNIEKLYLNEPDYILISHNMSAKSIELFKKNLKRLDIDSKVIIINDDIFVRPSYRIVEACQFLRKLDQ